MNPVWRIAKTEALEQRRQPWMIVVLAVNYLVVNSAFALAMIAINALTSSEADAGRFAATVATFNIDLDHLIGTAITSINTLNFGTLLVYVAITTGTVVLHDRDCGVMPFLMLAPVTRFQLLAGKLVGAMVFPLIVYAASVALTNVPLSQLRLVAPFAGQLGASAGWWLTFFITAPAAALFAGALCTVISAMSRDFRTSMQFTSALISILGAAFGFLMVDALKRGAGWPLAWAGTFVIATIALLTIGAKLISTDATP
jgi:ABC-type transport system involved in multi-copper enzyme maturation permease subunit